MRKRHVVFVLPSIGRLAYHFSALQALVETGNDITFVSCRRRSPTPSPEDAEFLRIIDDFQSKHQNFRSIYEDKRGEHIRSLSAEKQPGRKRHSSRNHWHLLRTFSKYLQRLPRDNFYVRRWKGYLPENFRRLADKRWFCFLLRRRSVYWLLTRAERSLKPDPRIEEWLIKVGADAVVVSPANTRNSVEAEFLLAARKLGIPTAVPVLSWDNLSTKGLIPFGPDAVLAWNEHQAREARLIHDIPQERVIVTGSPFFDKWFDRFDLLEERTPFLCSLGLDPSKPVLLYLGSSKNIARNESWLVKKLLRAMAENDALGSVQVLVRPHPANPTMCDDLRGEKQVTLLGSEVPFTDRATRVLLNVMSHAFAVVGLNTTGLVDAVALDRPCFSVKTDRYHDTHLKAVHFQHMIQAGAIGVAEDIPALANCLREVLDGRDGRSGQRYRFIESCLRPRGRTIPAGQVAARTIILLAEGRTAAEVNQALGSGLGLSHQTARSSPLEETAATL